MFSENRGVVIKLFLVFPFFRFTKEPEGVVSSCVVCLCLQVHSAQQSGGEAESGAEGGAGDEPLPESQSGAAAVPAGRGGTQRKRDR